MCHRLHHELVARVEYDSAGGEAAAAAGAAVVPEALTQGGGDRSTAAAPEHGYSSLRPCITSSLWIPELPFARNMLEWVGASIMASSGLSAAAAAAAGPSLSTPLAKKGRRPLDVSITPRQYAETGVAPKLPDWLSPPSVAY